MSQKLSSNVKLALVASLLFAVASGYLGTMWASQAHTLRAAVVEESNLAKDDSARHALYSKLTPGEPAKPVDVLMDEIQAAIREHAPAFGVTPVSVEPGTAVTSAIDKGALKVGTLILLGGYSKHQELVGFLTKITEDAVSVAYLKIEESSFEVHLQVFGGEASSPATISSPLAATVVTQ